MYPSDSISSFKIPVTHEGGLDEGDFIGKEGVMMPLDVIEALNDDNLELAMFLLDRYREADGTMDTFARRPDSSKIKQFFLRFQFPLFKRLNAKRASRKTNKSQTVVPAAVIVYVAKAARKMVVIMMRTPVNLVTTVILVGMRVIPKGLKFLEKQIIKPIISVVVRPFVKVTEIISERYRAMELLVSKGLEKAQEKFKVYRKIVGQKIEKLTQELRELSLPARLWMENKFDELIRTQRWMNRVVGKQVEKIAHQSIQVIAYALVPVIFSMQQITKRYKSMVKKIGKGSKDAFSKTKKWLKGQMAKGAAVLNRTILLFAGAIERLLSRLGLLLLRALKIILSVIGAILQFLFRLILRLFQIVQGFISVKR